MREYAPPRGSPGHAEFTVRNAALQCAADPRRATMMSEADKEDAYRSQALQAGKAPSTSEIKFALAAAGGSLDRALAAAGYPPLLPPLSKAVTEVVEAQAYAPFTSPQEAYFAPETIPVPWHAPTTRHVPVEARSRPGRPRPAADEEGCSEECLCACTRKVLMGGTRKSANFGMDITCYKASAATRGSQLKTCNGLLVGSVIKRLDLPAIALQP